jgi:hypothetical protein
MELQVHVKRLIVMQEFGVGKQGLCFDGLAIDLKPNPETDTIAVTSACDYFQGRGPDQSDMTAKGIRFEGATTNDAEALVSSLAMQKACLSIHEILTFRLPGVVSLAMPVHNTIARLEDGWLAVACDSLQLFDLQTESRNPENSREREGSREDSNDKSQSADLLEAKQIDLPMPVRFKVPRVLVQSAGSNPNAEQSIEINHLFVECMPTSQTTPMSLRLKCGSLSLTSGTVVNGAASGISLSTKWEEGPTRPQTVPYTVPGLGVLVFASGEVDLCSSFKLDAAFALIEPVHNAKISFHENTVFLNFGALHVEMFEGSKTASSKEPEARNALMDIPFLLHLDSLRAKVPPGPLHADVCVKKL